MISSSALDRMPPFIILFCTLKKVKAIPKNTVQITSAPAPCDNSCLKPRLAS